VTISPELIALLSDREIERKINELADARARAVLFNDDVAAIAALDGDLHALKDERRWREHERRKYASDDASD
jgi:hypothetical protein